MRSPSTQYRDTVSRWLRVALVTLITLSSALVATFNGATTEEIGVITATGLIVGALVVWIAFPHRGT